MVDHRQKFHHELEAIEAKVIELLAMVAEDLPGATQALLTGNSEVIKALGEREQAIDALYPEIEPMANRQILLQAPVASDLRFLLSVLRIVPELERSHDLVVEIARLADHILSEDLSPRSRGLIGRMGNLASGMWRQAADAWNQRDRSAAFVLGERDDEMDELHASLIAELASGRMTIPVAAVAAEQAQVDAADEGDAVVDDHELLVVAVERPLPRVERHRDPRASGELVACLTHLASVRVEHRQRRTRPGEHAHIDPLRRPIDAAAADPDYGYQRFGDIIDELSATLTAHLAHEEADGLPLIDASLAPAEWQHFAQVHAERIAGDAPTYMPWLLNGASPQTLDAVLGKFPPPLLTAFREQWGPKYAALDIWPAVPERA